MSVYQIHQWNQIIDSTNVLRPIFTFVPDSNFVDYILNNPGTLLLQVKGTGIYDGKQYATCTSSSDFPNFGPTYFNTTKQYVMVLHTSFVTYPFENGSFIISTNIRHPKDVNTIEAPYQSQEPEPEKIMTQEFYQEDDFQQPTQTFIYILVSILSLLILLLLIFLYIR
jgi:hypothetical protein